MVHVRAGHWIIEAQCTVERGQYLEVCVPQQASSNYTYTASVKAIIPPSE